MERNSESRSRKPMPQRPRSPSSSHALTAADTRKVALTKFPRISIVGLGYVGLPSAVFLGEAGFHVIGADVKEEAVRLINGGKSHLSDLGMDDRVRKLVAAGRLRATTDVASAVSESDAVFIMVPTPLAKNHEPDLSYVKAAGRSIARGLRPGQLVILESTVYPGVTEQVLRPELERSGFRAGKDFGLAYCPERYNPGDSEHTIAVTQRIVGGITPESGRDAKELYETITSAGVVQVPDIRTCEAAKIIENTQRDLNIALMNEFALILERLGLDVSEVLDAAATKWNFVRFRPGPGVGGHCLPKDPYYLVKTAEKAGYKAQVITAGRRINDSMPSHVYSLVQRGLRREQRRVRGAKIAVLGLTYKENIGDTRLAPALEFTRLAAAAGANIITVDPFVPEAEARARFHSKSHVRSIQEVPVGVDAFVLLVGHADFLPIDWTLLRSRCKAGAALIDGPRLVAPEAAASAGLHYLGVGAGRHNGPA